MGLARTVLPQAARKIALKVAKSLRIGALTGLVSIGVNKLLGNGIYYKKGGNLYKIKVKKVVLFISKRDLQNVGEGLYLRNDNNEYVDGSGVIRDLAKHLPILKMLF